ncbi:DUF6519 domain-containing protein [Candidatus Bipolaricaulota bacterium]
MKGDFSRFTDDPKKHYSGVLKQQGRVDLDADWNEEIAIRQHLSRTTRKDVIGLCGVPSGASGFEITIGENTNDLFISPGRIYVDGILCELERGTPLTVNINADGTSVVVTVPISSLDEIAFKAGQWVELSAGAATARFRIGTVGQDGLTFPLVNPDGGAATPAGFASGSAVLRRLSSYETQVDYPGTLPIVPPSSGSRIDQVYLDVWERGVSVLDDPGIREVALGGVDTTTRKKTIAQVKVIANFDVGNDWPPERSTAKLSVSTDTPPEAADPCLLAPSGGYQGLENRLYRVEIHQGGIASAATFKWSRDNAAVAFPVSIDGEALTTVTLLEPGKDRTQTLEVGDWIEIASDETILHEEPGTLTQITVVDRSKGTVTVANDISDHAGEAHLRAIRWDHASAAIPITIGQEVHLEDGIYVTFGGSDFKSGDYWTFAARAVTGDVDPLDQAPPHGIVHHYCRLAKITWDDDDSDTEDEREEFDPLTDQIRFFHVGGTGQEVMPPPGGTDTKLAKPLQVGVTRGGVLVEGAQVRFATLSGGAVEAVSGSPIASGAAAPLAWIVVETDTDGIAKSNWKLDASGDHTQEATAELWQGASANADGMAVADVPPLSFNANLSIASQIAVDSQLPGCSSATTVQDALADLCGRTQVDYVALRYISGNGQSGITGETLPVPLTVGLENHLGQPAFGAVQFQIEGYQTYGGELTADGLSQDSNGTLEVPVTQTDNPDGIAAVTWLLGTFPVPAVPLRVTAQLMGSDTFPIHFYAAKRIVAPSGGGDGGCLCTVTLGEVEDDTLAQAVGRLQEMGLESGCICVPAREWPHWESIAIENLQQLTIRGCGPASKIVLLGDASLQIMGAPDVRIENLSIEATDPSIAALHLADCGRVRLTDLTITTSGGRPILAERCPDIVLRNSTATGGSDPINLSGGSSGIARVHGNVLECGIRVGDFWNILFNENRVYTSVLPTLQLPTVNLNASRLIVMGNYVEDGYTGWAAVDFEIPCVFGKLAVPGGNEVVWDKTDVTVGPGTSIYLPNLDVLKTGAVIGNITRNGVRHDPILNEAHVVVTNNVVISLPQ